MHTVVNSPASLQTHVAHSARSAATIRRWLYDIAADLDTERLDDLSAVATELVCNAVQHAVPLSDGSLTIECRRDDGSVEVAVTDGGSGTTPLLQPADTNSVTGRGLVIVNALSDQWGVRDAHPGRTVWARLPGKDMGVGGDS